MKKTETERQEADELLKGWAAIASFLGIPVTTAHRWARDGMPVRREGRFMVANKRELQTWLGRESHMPAPAQVVSGKTDLASALRESISAMREMGKKPRRAA